jgi:alpha-amylase
VTARLSFALAIHNHQPVGNFGWVYAEAYRQAYLPFLEALERHPAIRIALHYSGPLLRWLAGEQPVFLERLAALVARPQVELMGGGYYEPILAALPERDRLGQLRRMADEIERIAGFRPRGAWLAERVWEPSLPATLADAGYGWTIVDDVHFRAASIPADAAWGHYSTDDQGRRIDVFATDQRLRYGIPFSEPEVVLDYLRSLADESGERLATMGDDGEKFGSWPRTFEHCWGEDRWVDRFFEALEAASGWLTTTTPSDWSAAHPPLGRAYIPTASYIEMTEWALPPDESVAFHAALALATAADAPEARWLRGGFWRNYLARYREINDLHKAMVRASDRVAAMPTGAARDRALDHLYQGQSNDTYWHGVFGGVYITHLRLATWEHVIAAEDIAAGAAGSATPAVGSAVLADADLDGRDEALLEAEGQLVVVDLAEGGGIGEWDLRAPRHAMTAVLRRRPEAAHLRLLEAAQREAAGATGASGAAAGSAATSAAEAEDAGAPASTIHDLVAAKEEGLAARITYDWHERRSGLVHLLDPATTQDEFASAQYVDGGDFADGPFEVVSIAPGVLRLRRDGHVAGGEMARPLRVEKTLTLGGGRGDPSLRLEVAVENTAHEALETMLGVEWAINLAGGGANPQAYYRVAGTRTAHDGWGAHEAPGVVAFGNDWLGVEVEAMVEPTAGVWWQPIETVSNSESGFERVYQGSALLFRWPLRLEPAASATVSVLLATRCTRDRGAEESRA